ncbi:hypothetical protein ACFPRL_20120 [Pseudoclavibacter helvolus]
MGITVWAYSARGVPRTVTVGHRRRQRGHGRSRAGHEPGGTSTQGIAMVATKAPSECMTGGTVSSKIAASPSASSVSARRRRPLMR